jgi:maleate cis-trans isomerase
MSQQTPEHLVERPTLYRTIAVDPREAEAVLFSGNGFRAIGAIAALEADLGRPVLRANQVAFWYALRQAGVHAPVNGYGRLFRALDLEAT